LQHALSSAFIFQCRKHGIYDCLTDSLLKKRIGSSTYFGFVLDFMISLSQDLSSKKDYDKVKTKQRSISINIFKEVPSISEKQVKEVHV